MGLQRVSNAVARIHHRLSILGVNVLERTKQPPLVRARNMLRCGTNCYLTAVSGHANALLARLPAPGRGTRNVCSFFTPLNTAVTL